MVIADQFLLLLKLFLHMQNEIFEILGVINDQLRDDCLVDLSRRELILSIFHDHCSQFGEV